MAIAVGAMPEHPPAAIHLVQLGGDLVAARAGADQLQPAPMHRKVALPNGKAGIVGMPAEQRSPESREVAEQHRKAVQGNDVPRPDHPVRHRIVRAVGIDTGLQPDPAVQQVDRRETGRNLARQGVQTGKRDLVLRRTCMKRRDARRPRKVGDPCSFADQGLLFHGFDQPHHHRRLSDIDEVNSRQRSIEQAPEFQRDMVELDPKTPRTRRQLANGAIEIVPAPVAVGDIRPATPPPRMPAVDSGRNRRRRLLCDDHPIAATEGAVQPAGEIGNPVMRRQQDRIHLLCRHPPAQGGLAPRHFRGAEGREGLLSVVPFHDMQHVGSHVVPP